MVTPVNDLSDTITSFDNRHLLEEINNFNQMKEALTED